MSLQNLINVAKCPTCPNMVPMGRLRPDMPRKCDTCKRAVQKLKRKIQGRNRYRNNHPKQCDTCGQNITFTFGPRAEICEDCKVKVKLRYLSQTCIYCDKPLTDKPQAKFCSHTCQMKTLYIIHGRKKV
jgi:hypothetical protein